MAVKLDRIVTQAELNLFKIKPSTSTLSIQSTQNIPNNSSTILFNIDNKPIFNDTKLSNINIINNTNQHHQMIKIIDSSQSTNIQSINTQNNNSNVQNGTNTSNEAKSLKSSSKRTRSSDSVTTMNNSTSGEVKKEPVSRGPDTTVKRNKQQRQFNTFVRESINQLLGHDFMRTHDVQDIDPQVMEMIRKEAVENYLPDNIRPRRAWHLAKASLRTLKRTLNNRKV